METTTDYGALPHAPMNMWGDKLNLSFRPINTKYGFCLESSITDGPIIILGLENNLRKVTNGGGEMPAPTLTPFAPVSNFVLTFHLMNM